MLGMKRISVILCMVLALVSFGAASATTTPRYEEAFTFDYISSVIEDGPYFKVVDTKKGFKEGVLDRTGAIAVPSVFGDLDYLEHGLFSAQNESGLNNKALVDMAGNVLTGYEYADFEALSEKWIIGVQLRETTTEPFDYSSGFFGSGDKKFIVTQYDIFNIGKGYSVGTLERAKYKDATAVGDYLLVEDRSGAVQLYDAVFNPVTSAFTDRYDDEFYVVEGSFGQKAIASRITGEKIAEGYTGVETIDGTDLLAARQSGSWNYVLMDRNGNLVSDQQFSGIGYAYGGYMDIQQNNLWGLYDIAAGAIVIPCQYDDIDYVSVMGDKSYVINGYVCVEKDKKLGYVDLNGNITCEIKYAEAVSRNLGCSIMVTDIDGTMAIISADGVMTRGFQDIDEYSGDGYFIVAKNNLGKWGVIDWHGNVVVPHASDDDYFSLYGDVMRYDDTVYTLHR